MDKRIILIKLLLFPLVPSTILFFCGKKTAAAAILIIYYFFTILNLIFPKFQILVQRSIKLLGNIISKTVLFIGYWVIIVPNALISKFFKRDRLKLKKYSTDSYWIDENQEFNYERQF